MDRNLQIIITKLAQSPQSFNDLRSLLQVESSSIKEHITNELRQNQRHLAYQNYCQHFLNSLWYPEIHRRRETVSKAHEKTFEWIYELDGFDPSNRRWDSIIQWLEHGEGIYWVSGKAGSGKSTLMSYIYDNDRTSKLLGIWSGAKDVFVPSYFFWSSGNELEKSSEGLLRSLLCQILQKFPNLTPSGNEDNFTQELDKEEHYQPRPIAAWTEHKLHLTLQHVMLRAQKTCRICIFIDGIDETSDDPDAAIAVIKSMLSANGKILLSSRRDPPYINAFDSSAKLRLQDLTESDVRTYVWDKLQPFLGRDKMSEIVDRILDKAQGVFLWVELVVKELIRGLQNDDSVTQLQERVDSTPSDIEALYVKMLSKIEHVYCPEAAFLFRIALEPFTHSLLDVTLALCKEVYNVSDVSIQTALYHCRKNQKRIPILCAGLLEVNTIDEASEKGGKGYGPTHFLTLPRQHTCSSEQEELSSFERSTHITFIHRTAEDFMRKAKQGQNFLNTHVQHPSPRPALVRGLLAKVTLLGFPENPGHYIDDPGGNLLDEVAREFVGQVMLIVMVNEGQTDTAQVALCNDIDRTITAVAQRYQRVAALSHWCVRWAQDPFGELSGKPIQWPRAVSLSSSRVACSLTTTSESVLFQNEIVDLLAFAAAWGLCPTALEMFNLRQDQLDMQYTNQLLFYIVRAKSIHLTGTGQAALQLIARLLSRGGNPNIYPEKFSSTIWGMFLTGHNRDTRSFGKDFAMTVKAFLESGADVHLKVPAIFRLSPSKVPLETEISFRLEYSVLYLIQRLLDTIPELKPLEDLVLKKGGRDFRRRVTHVASQADNYRVHRVSKDQSEALMTALGTTNIYNLHEVNRWLHLDTALFETCKEILGTAGECDIYLSSDDEDAASDPDTEQKFYDSVDTLTVANEQESEPAE